MTSRHARILHVALWVLVGCLAEVLAVRYFRWEGHFVAGMLLAIIAGMAFFSAATICVRSKL